MKMSKMTNDYKKNFILPEYRNKPESFFKNMQSEKYMISLNNLRFVVPELIFNPNIIGIEEGGLHEGIIQSINECHSDYKNLLYENIITTGGNTKFLNFNERLFNELNCTIDHDFIRNVKIFPQEKIKNSNEYIEPVIEGMKLFARNSSLIQDLAITKKEYDDIGFNIVWKTCY